MDHPTTSYSRHRLRAAATVVATALLGVGLTTTTAPPASAAVWACSTGFASTGAFATCLRGDSTSFRVTIMCQNWLKVYTGTKYGPWVPLGHQSTAQCNWGDSYLGPPVPQGR